MTENDNLQMNNKEPKFFELKEFELIDFDSINVTLVETTSEDLAYNFLGVYPIFQTHSD